MDFPAYVPAAARLAIESLIVGDRSARHGYAQSLASAEARLTVAEYELEAAIKCGDSDLCDQLRIAQAEALEHRDSMVFEVQCLQRLAHDARMQTAYAWLTAVFTDDRQWRAMIHAAWSARIDFSVFRENLKLAASLKSEIAESADKLAALLDRFGDTGDHGPGEFFSVQALLESTDNHESNDRNLYMWRGMRKYVFGNEPLQRAVNQEKDDVDFDGPIKIRIVPLDTPPVIDPVEETRNTLRYAWRTAPPVSAVIRTLAATARAFTPAESGMIGAAIQTRQSNPATEYLRAFAYSLTKDWGFTLTAPVMRAMSVIATVVIGEAKTDITYDDVRKVVLKLSQFASMENSN